MFYLSRKIYYRKSRKPSYFEKDLIMRKPAESPGLYTVKGSDLGCGTKVLCDTLLKEFSKCGLFNLALKTYICDAYRVLGTAAGAEAARRSALYSSSDGLVLLRGATARASLLAAPTAWAVEFFASWCGHCVAFAPTWKALAGDVGDWKPVLTVGALDCADEDNVAACRDFEISGFPTVKFFKAFSRTPSAGEALSVAGASVQELREKLITALETHQGTWPPAWPSLEPARLEEINSFFTKNRDQFLALIFEKKGSFVGREVTLDLSQYEGIAVRRVLDTETVVIHKYRVTSFPSCYLLSRNSSISRVPVLMETRSFYTAYLQRLPGVTKGPYRPTVSPASQETTTPIVWRSADSSKVYMADLESSLHYILRLEVGKYPVLTGERLEALKSFVAVLAKYFPGRPLVQNFLQELNKWLKDQRRQKILYSTFEAVLTRRKEGNVLTNKVTWVGCQGSKPQFRGFPCSLWILFHFLTVQAAQHTKYSLPNTHPQEVLSAIRGYVRFFFGCRDCAAHFEEMAAASMDRVKSQDEAILWLWSRHNQVNSRLAGAPSEDPRFPKIQWPPRSLCAPCHNELRGEPVWDLGAILNFFKAHFSPGNIASDYAQPLPARGRRHSVGERERKEMEEDLTTATQAWSPSHTEKPEGTFQTEEGREPVMERSVLGTERRGSHQPQRPRIIRMSTKAQEEEEEEEIVDLDAFTRDLYKRETQPGASVMTLPRQQLPQGRRLSKRDTVPLLLEGEGEEEEEKSLLKYAAALKRLKQQGQGAKQLASILEGKEGVKAPLGGLWLRLLGGDFSLLDISLCIGLYFLSSMCLLGMYAYFRLRMRVRKGRASYPLSVSCRD
ncbi:sulfhydryl oxidase 1 [Ornithorhynchus anatinus]|uniref:sulfhydryl oxidase 1 n=1 Tax=Ornithorhynchus anatinus TaxID=9258 RepID=UPI0010A77910|nr:sulfhydryl oxidase 1 [Ornithorhynchus anatinus]